MEMMDEGKKRLLQVKGVKMGVQYISKSIITLSYLLTAECCNHCSSNIAVVTLDISALF